jgi:hypothetical protein
MMRRYRLHHNEGGMDKQNNIFIFCPKGIIILKSMDVFDKVKSAQLFCETMEEVGQKVGKHVMQIVTNDASTYMATSVFF